MKLDNDVKQLILLFNKNFGESHNVKLLSDRDEPVYYPASESVSYNRIIFANGYFNSALHEISHWVVAGEKRRQLEDYGYWYHADGRNVEQQRQFEELEILPQAIEKAFSEAVGRDFSASVDNLQAPIERSQIELFSKRIKDKLAQLQQQGFPCRAAQFLEALSAEFG